MDEKNPACIHVFAAEDVIVEPQITGYDFEYAYNTGNVQEVYGMLSGASEGTWYTII